MDLKASLRTFVSFYLSLVLHALFLYWVFGAVKPWDPYICGPDRIYFEPKEETSFVFEMEFGDSDSDKEGAGQEEGEGEETANASDEGNFDANRFKGTEWEQLVEDLESTKELRGKFKNTIRDLISNSNVAESYIHRPRDYEDIIIKEVFPTVKSIDKPFAEQIESAPKDLEKFLERNKIIKEFRGEEGETQAIQMEPMELGKSLKKEPLQFPKPERLPYLDKTLTLKKEKQLSDFLDRFMGYHPDKGDLPEAVRDLYYENLQRLAYTFSGDPSHFTLDYYQENLNKEDYLKNSMSLVSEFLGTKTGTELLFTIENIYEIQGRALLQYFQFSKILPSLSPEQRQELRVETLRRVNEKYKSILAEKKIKSESQIQSLYAQKRLEILDFLIANTPDQYRQNDAYFEKGRIYWERGLATNDTEDFALATETWAKVKKTGKASGDFLNQETFEEIQNYLKNDTPPYSQNMRYTIANVLNGRLQKTLSDKKEREDRLLWKKAKD